MSTLKNNMSTQNNHTVTYKNVVLPRTQSLSKCHVKNCNSVPKIYKYDNEYFYEFCDAHKQFYFICAKTVMSRIWRKLDPTVNILYWDERTDAVIPGKVNPMVLKITKNNIWMSANGTHVNLNDIIMWSPHLTPILLEQNVFYDGTHYTLHHKELTEKIISIENTAKYIIDNLEKL